MPPKSQVVPLPSLPPVLRARRAPSSTAPPRAPRSGALAPSPSDRLVSLGPPLLRVRPTTFGLGRLLVVPCLASHLPLHSTAPRTPPHPSGLAWRPGLSSPLPLPLCRLASRKPVLFPYPAPLRPRSIIRLVHPHTDKEERRRGSDSAPREGRGGGEAGGGRAGGSRGRTDAPCDSTPPGYARTPRRAGQAPGQRGAAAFEDHRLKCDEGGQGLGTGAPVHASQARLRGRGG